MMDNMGRWIPDFPGQQPWQDRQFMTFIGQQAGQAAPQQTPAPQAALKPITIRADIIQFTDPAEIINYQMAPGTSQMFMRRDEALIIIREQGPNGYTLKRYPLEPPEPPKPEIDPEQIVTWDRLEERLAQIMPAQAAPRRTPTKAEDK